MIDWPEVWGFLIAGALFVFAVLAIVVGVGGYFDILSLFQKLRKENEDTPPE